MPASGAADLRRTHAVRHMRDGAITLLALLLAFAAFDDITTDRATAFPVEYSFLTVCAAWLAFVAVRLLRERRYLLGMTSLAALTGGLRGQRGIGPGITPGFWPEYVVTSAALVWFLLVSLVLFWLGWRDHPHR